jgi:hypothetical protein
MKVMSEIPAKIARGFLKESKWRKDKCLILLKIIIKRSG